MSDQFSGTKDVADNLAFSLDNLNSYLESACPEVEKINYPNEIFHITDNCVYFLPKLGASKAKMSTNFFENKLKVTATARNYNTMKKLLSFCAS